MTDPHAPAPTPPPAEATPPGAPPAAGPNDDPLARPLARPLELALSPRDLRELLVASFVLSLVLGVGFYALDYLNLHRVEQGATPWQPETSLDAHVPLSPVWIWPYLVYFPFCFVPLLFCGRIERFRVVVRSYLYTYVPCLALFSVVPTKMDRPAFEVTDVTTRWLQGLYDFDPGYNIFPSLHCANAVLVAWIVQHWAPRWALPGWTLALAIAASTVLVKQHYVVDVPAGLLLGSVAYALAFRLGRKTGGGAAA